MVMKSSSIDDKKYLYLHLCVYIYIYKMLLIFSAQNFAVSTIFF